MATAISPVLMPFFAIPFIKAGVTLLFLVVGFWIVFRKLLPILQDPSQVKALGKLFASARSLPKNPSAKVTLQKKDRAVIVTLNRLKGVETTVIFQGKLMGLSAGAETMTRYRLNLHLPAANHLMIVNGDRREIEWLCNEVSEWSGIQAGH